MLAVVAALAVTSSSGRPIFIATIVLCLALVVAARVSRRALGPNEGASEQALPAWLRQAVEAMPDTNTQPF
jgi:hypothetical protein